MTRLNNTKIDLSKRDSHNGKLFTLKTVYSLISSKDSLQIIIALASYFDLDLYQISIRIAFLNGDLEEKVFTKTTWGSHC